MTTSDLKVSKEETPLIEIKNLTKVYRGEKKLLSRKTNDVFAVNNVSFSIKRGQTMGLVGESGCGKSTLGRCVIRLLEPTAGEIIFNGENITQFQGEVLRRLRRKMQIIFQDPYASLNPRMTVGDILREPLQVHKLHQQDPNKRIRSLLDLVGLRQDATNRYPHEFSGGQRQRICIARALAVEPEFIVCDEPVSALDVSIQAQVLNLLIDLQKEFGLTYLFISHDLKVVEHMSDHVAVMYLGSMVEVASGDSLYKSPRHPYTEALLSAIPSVDTNNQRQRIVLQGDVPSPLNPPSGCRFHPRCRYATPECSASEPELKSSGKDNRHSVACFHPLEGK